MLGIAAKIALFEFMRGSATFRTFKRQADGYLAASGKLSTSIICSSGVET